jgi:nitrate/TMAO reductase-like tetraheme cytochrome c subunit
MKLKVPILLLLWVSLLGCSQEGWKEKFRKEFMEDIKVGDQIERNVCLQCHASEIMTPAYREIPERWKQSWHYQNNVACQDCHGGDSKDAELAMSPQRGFVGVPKPQDVPEFCGKCHVGILENYLASGHGKALKRDGSGPNCVTCHGSHGIQKASIEIINEKRCTQCHSYERARLMKEALFQTEIEMRKVEDGIKGLKSRGVYMEQYDKQFFQVQAAFRTLFHSVEVDEVRRSSGEFQKSLAGIDAELRKMYAELDFRKTYSTAIMLVFLGMAGALIALLKTK